MRTSVNEQLKMKIVDADETEPDSCPGRDTCICIEKQFNLSGPEMAFGYYPEESR